MPGSYVGFARISTQLSWRPRVIIEPPTMVDGGNLALLRNANRLQFVGLQVGWCEFSFIRSSKIDVRV